MENHQRRRRTREDYARGLPDYHDPTGGWAGAAPAYSALTLRAVLAGFGVLCFLGGTVGFAVWHLFGLAVLFGVGALLAGGNLGWILYRKHRGEPG
jgi:hypothetical protein